MKIYQPTSTEIETAAADLLQQYPADPGRIAHAAALLLAGRLEYETAADLNAQWQRLGIDVHVPDPFHYWPCLQRPARDPGNPGRGGEQGHEQVDGRAHERARHQTQHPDHHQPNDGGGASCLLACGLALHGLRA